MSRPDPIAEALVKAALELHTRCMWEEVAADAPFLLRVPGEEFPLVVSITGHAGEDQGIVFARGAQAFEQTVSCILDRRDSREDLDAHTLLSITIEPLANVRADLRGVLTEAGVQARRSSQVPYVFSKPAFAEERNPSRAEMRLMLTSLQALFEVHDSGELRTRSLSRRRQRILQIVVEGEGRELTARAEMVPWPNATMRVPAQSFTNLAAVDSDMPRVDIDWLVLFVPIPNARLEDGRELGSLFIAELDDGDLLTSAVVERGDNIAVEKQLADALSDALPRGIVFGDADCHAAFQAQLTALGIRTTLDTDHPDTAFYRQMYGRFRDEGIEDDADERESLPHTDENS